MAIKYTRAIPVVKNDSPTAWHYNRLADAVNNRLTQGLGDPTWRIFWYAHSLFRNLREPLDENNFPAADEWWKFYAFIDPERNSGVYWPQAAPGDPEGAATSNPIMAFIYGIDGNDSLPGEDTRLNTVPIEFADYPDQDAVETAELNFPMLRFGAPDTFIPYSSFIVSPGIHANHSPLSKTEAWEMGKNQRGGYDPGTGVAYTPAMSAPRYFLKFQYASAAPYLKTYTSFQPLPNSAGTCPPLCFDCPSYPSYQIKFSPLRSGLPIITFPGTCSGTPGHVNWITRGSDRYVVYINDGPTRTFMYSDYIEGPYEGGGQPVKLNGEQLNQATNNFASNFKGSLTEKADPAFSICDKGFDFQSFFSRQYSLTPCTADYESIDDTLNMVYPRFFQVATGTDMTIATNAMIHNTVKYNDSSIVPQGFVCAGYYIYISRGELSKTYHLDLLNGGATHSITLVTDTNGCAEKLLYFNAPLTGDISLKNIGDPIILSGGSSTFSPDLFSLNGQISCELAFLAAQKPEIPDAYLFLRFGSAHSDIDTGIDGRGQDVDLAKTMSDTYLQDGIIRGPVAISSNDTAANFNPVYDAARLLVKDNLRMIDRGSFRGYEVAGGKSILYFNRNADKNTNGAQLSYEPVPLDGPSNSVVTGSSKLGLLENKTYVVTTTSVDSLGGETIIIDPRYGPQILRQNFANYPAAYQFETGNNDPSVNQLFVGQTFTTNNTIERLYLNSNKIQVAQVDYSGLAPSEGRYACGANHYYLCTGKDYIVDGYYLYGYPTGETPGDSNLIRVAPRIWLTVDATTYYMGYNSDGNYVPVTYQAGENFTCPATVTGFTLRPPDGNNSSQIPVDPINGIVINGSVKVKAVLQPNIQSGSRYRVFGSGHVNYNGYETFASSPLCALFDSTTGKGSAANGGPCCEFKGVSGATIATLGTGGESLGKWLLTVTPTDGADQFQGLGPSRDPVTLIQTGVTYIVKVPTSGNIFYNGNTYTDGQTFTGTTLSNLPVEIFTPTGDAEVFEIDGVKNVAPMKGFTNQWSMFTSFNVYHWSESSEWKPTAYGDQLCFLHNRCNLLNPDWLNIANKDLLLQFSYGQKPVIVSETPSGYTYIRGTNQPPGYWDLQTRIWYYQSCQIYKPDVKVEKAEMLPDSDEIKITFTGRLQTCCNVKAGGCGSDVPSSSPCRMNDIPRNYFTLAGAGSQDEFDRRMTVLRAEPFKTDENSILEYVACDDTNCTLDSGEDSHVKHCQRSKIGDGAASSVIWGLPDDPFGGCLPRFYFTKLVPYVYPYAGTVTHPVLAPSCDRNTRLDVVPFNQMEFYIRAMCGGFVDGRSNKNNFDCNDPTAKLYDYSFEQLCYQSLVDTSSTIVPTATAEIYVTERITIQWNQGSQATEPKYVIERMLVAKLPDGSPEPNPSWVTVATVDNDGQPTQSYLDVFSYLEGTVHHIEYKVSAFHATEVDANVETPGTGTETFTMRTVSWDTVATSSNTGSLGRDLNKL